MHVKRHQSEVFTNGSIIENYLDEEAKVEEDRYNKTYLSRVQEERKSSFNEE